MLIKYKLHGRVCKVNVKPKYSADVIATLVMAGAKVSAVLDTK